MTTSTHTSSSDRRGTAATDPAGLPPLAAPAPGGTLITISSGVYSLTVPAGNLTVGQIRERLRVQLDLDADALAYLDGEAVDDEDLLQGGQLLHFQKHAGAKG